MCGGDAASRQIAFLLCLDHRQNRSRVYRVWQVADWARNISHDHFRYDVQTGSVQILTSGLYLIYSQVSSPRHVSSHIQKMVTQLRRFCTPMKFFVHWFVQ